MLCEEYTLASSTRHCEARSNRELYRGVCWLLYKSGIASCLINDVIVDC